LLEMYLKITSLEFRLIEICLTSVTSEISSEIESL
jgi:hypothetical protein